jgi:hypothetical protein
MSAGLVNWTRPEKEAKNSRLPKRGDLVQHLLRYSDLFYESTVKTYERDAEKSAQTGMDTRGAPGYRLVADKLGCCARTAFSRMKRMKEIGLAHFERRYAENGAPAGSFVTFLPWKTWLDDQKQNPQIAKTPAGEIISRNGTPLSVEEAERLGIRYVATAAAAPAKAKAAPRTPAAAPAMIPVNVAALAAVLHRFEILDDAESTGARSLLASAREQVPDITAEDLAAELNSDLTTRARAKEKRHETLRINVPYVATFIRSVAGRWAAWRADRRAAERQRADAAVRASRAAEELNAQWAYEQFEREAMDRWIASLDPAVYAGLTAEALAQVRKEYPRLTDTQQQDLAPQFVRHMQRAAAGIPSMDEWRETHRRPPDIPPTG